jgi:predicted negative regulator of RcsB-dependent stress response
MKKFIKDNWFRLSLLVIVIIALGGWFYWFEFRPSQIREKCNSESFLYNSSNNYDPVNSPAWLDKQEKLYKDCLRFKGLDK